MNSHHTHIQKGLSRWFALLSLIILLIGPAAGPVPVPMAPQTLPPATPAILNDLLDTRPLPSLPKQFLSPENKDKVSTASLNIDCSLGNLSLIDRQNLFTTTVYQYASGARDWDIKAGPVCNLDSNIVIAKSAADELSPGLSYDAQQVVFVTDRDGNDEIYRVPTAGGAAVRLTNNRATDTQPAFSPDGHMVAFASDRSGNADIYTMTINGGSLRHLTSGTATDVYPEWTPDGKHIIFTRRSGLLGQIYIMNADGTAQKPLTGSLYLLGHARVSPDGKMLAFEYDQDQDGWIDIGQSGVDGSGIKMVLHTAPSYDYQLGNWMANGIGLFVVSIRYILYNSHYYIDRSYMIQCPLQDGLNCRYYGQNFGDYYLASDERNPDRQAPVSGIEPLPEFYPADQTLVISWWARDSGGSKLYSANWSISSGGNYTSGPGGISPGFSDEYANKDYVQLNAGWTYYIKTHAEDMSGNVEPEHIPFNAMVRAYRYRMDGRVVDVRNNPLGQVTVSSSKPSLLMNTAQTDSKGETQLYLSNAGNPQVDFNHAGLPPATQTWTVNQNGTFFNVMRGLYEQVTNGQFLPVGDALSGWQVSGPLSVVEAPGRLDGASALFQNPCGEGLCLSQPVEAGNASMMVVDSAGQVQALSPSGIYRTRLLDGTWQDGSALPSGSYQSLTLGLNDELLVVETSPDAQLWRKPAGGDWSALALPGPLYSAGLFVDTQGTIHLAYDAQTGSNQRSVYLTRLIGDQWSVPIELRSNLIVYYANAYPRILVDKAGNTHVIFRAYAGDLFYKEIDPAGKIISTKDFYLESGTVMDTPMLKMDSSSALHVVTHAYCCTGNGTSQNRYAYWTRPAGGSWSAGTTFYTRYTSDNYQYLHLPNSYGEMQIDEQGTLHVVLMDSAYQMDSQVIYATRPAGGTFSLRKASLPQVSTKMAAVMGDDGNFRLLSTTDSGSYYYESERASADALGSIQQVLHLPVEMHAPTLSFFYKFDQLVPGSQSGVEALVLQDGHEPVSLPLQLGDPAEWRHAWADLTPWIGQDVTLEIRFNQAAGEYPAHLFVDEVTVSDWRTPILKSVSPEQIGLIPPEGAWLRITGANLMAGSRVVLNDTEAGTVNYDSATGDLLVFIEASHPLGLFDVHVVAPGGQDSTLPQALRLGNWQFLPTVVH